MSVLSSMDLPTTDVDLGPEKIEDEKEGVPLFHCELCDTEVVHKVAEMLLPGLATSCVDNTAGGLFNTPGAVAADLRKEMIDYLTQRSESFVAEFVVLEGGPDGEVMDNPFDIISGFVDDFAISKRNLFSRFSGWLLSERREDRIDDIVQEMEKNGFWSLDRRQTLAVTLIKNVDFKNSFHCSMRFNSLEELGNHAHNCTFRSIICQNEGCDARFCASHLEKHDSTCPFKIIPCEQKCSDNIMRREMDRHCITKCPMKLVNCPFYAVGCRSPIAQCMIEKHRADELQSHLLYTIRGIYKEASEEDLKPRAEQILQASSNSRLAEARDVRFFTSIVKDLDSKLGPLEIRANNKIDAENNALNEDSEDWNIKEKGSEQSTETPNMSNSSDKSEVSDLDSAQLHNKNKDAKDSNNLEIKGNEESTKTNMKNSSEKTDVTTTNKDTTETNIKNNNIEENKYQDKDNEESFQTSEMENKGSAENNVKNKDITDNTLEDKGSKGSPQTTKAEKLSDKTEVSSMKKDSEESDGS